jgi:hypothetical protein
MSPDLMSWSALGTQYIGPSGQVDLTLSLAELSSYFFRLRPMEYSSDL